MGLCEMVAMTEEMDERIGDTSEDLREYLRQSTARILRSAPMAGFSLELCEPT